MRVTLSNVARHWTFHLARELDRRGLLERLITGYPKSHAVRAGVSPGRIAARLRYQIAQRAWGKLPAALRGGWDATSAILEHYDRAAAALIPEGTTIFDGWGDVSLHSFRRAKALGAKTVLERGNAHIHVQSALLREEYERLELPPALPDAAAVERGLAEYEMADWISVPSTFVLNTFLAKGFPASKFIRTTLGVDLAAFTPAPAPPDVFRVIYCGTVCVRKGAHDLLRAFSRLRVPGAELWMIGPVEPALAPFVARHAGPGVRIFGVRPGADIPKLIAAGSVLCLPSVEEGLGMVFLEAMASGLPVLSSTHTGISDVIRDGVEGWIVPVRDPDAIAEKLAWFAAHPERSREMGRAALLRVREFTWELYGDRMVANYRMIAGAAGT